MNGSIVEEKLRYKPAYRKVLFITYSENKWFSRSKAKEIASHLENSWKTDKTKKSLLDKIIKIIPATSNLKFAPSEQLRIRDEHIATVLDFPRIYCEEGINFDSRFCISLCHIARSTKIWSRIHLHFNDITNTYCSYGKEELNNFRNSHKMIADTISKWAFTFYKDTLQLYNKEYQMNYLGDLNLYALGVNDNKLNCIIEKFEDQEKNLNTIKNSEQIKRYFKHWNDFFGNDFVNDNLITNSDDHFWFNTSSIVLNNQNLEKRSLIYFSKLKTENNTSIINLSGIGYDNLSTDYLTMRSSHRISRYYGSKI